MTHIIVRDCQEKDLPRVREIYDYYVQNTSYSFAYETPSEADFKAHLDSPYPFVVAEDQGHVIGYAYAQSFKSIPAYRYCCEISIYVDHKQMKAGVGSKLIQALEERLSNQEMNLILSHITDTNQASLAFHKKHGYQLLGKFPAIGYKFDQFQGTIMLGKHLRQNQ